MQRRCDMFLHFKCLTSRCLNTALLSARRILKLVLLSFFLFIPSYANAVTYYLDTTLGNDTNTGTDVTTPWKTIAKVSSYKFQPGDSILFKRGCVWREQLTISSSGIEGNPITYGAYGAGDKPIITGADIVDGGGWSLYSGNIYVTTVGNFTSPNQLYVDGVFYDMAHYPNSGWLLATADSTNTTSIIDANLNLATSQIVGATIVMRALAWTISTSTITAYSPSIYKIDLSAPIYDTSTFMRTGCGFYLQNKFWMLDSPGEWYYDFVTGKLYTWMPGGDSPSSHIVEVPRRLYGIINNGKNYVTIQDLAITKAVQNDVYVFGSSSIVLNRLDISGGQIGIYFNTKRSSIQNCLVQNTLSIGIQSTYVVNNNIISNNTINNAGNVGVSPKNTIGGIYFSGDMMNVTNNIINNSGYIGIHYTGDLVHGNLITIENNVVSGSCLVLDDCAGIYSGNNGATSASVNIIGNKINKSVGNFQGTVYKDTQANGIYLDDYEHNTNVANNIISDSDFGIYIHSGYDNTVNGNTVYGARKSSLLLTENSSKSLPGSVHGIIVTNNIFENLSASATVYYYSTIEASTNFGSYDFNRYYHPNSNFVVRNQTMNYNLVDWQKVSGQDLNSTDSKSFAPRMTPLIPSNVRIVN